MHFTFTVFCLYNALKVRYNISLERFDNLRLFKTAAKVTENRLRFEIVEEKTDGAEHRTMVICIACCDRNKWQHGLLSWGHDTRIPRLRC